MNREEINRCLGVTEEQLDQWADEIENDEWHIDPNSTIHVRPITPEVRASIDRAVAYWDAKDADKAKKQVAGAIA
ncbi:hypothetical protein OZX62_01815 [Bifidobacterium sp. ESL0690]|uniref:hypothetical protein n=1 Tax=Bifidobacterium sp. ESL0690 TaxID=2983214 RepID=UPI0023F85A24|nr:hypothetical protein [Bifidobacterium sp. ESL0690]WEV47056.1 hypothetical protein OZX62_01815 [Bifidobacterium sp. ESL0690]